MKGFFKSGDTVELTAPYAVASGAGALVGTIFGIAVAAVASGAIGSFMLVGIHKGAKVGSQAWTEGAAIYWDNTNKYWTTTSAGNTKVGIAVKGPDGTLPGAGAGETTGYVRLNGIGV